MRVQDESQGRQYSQRRMRTMYMSMSMAWACVGFAMDHVDLSLSSLNLACENAASEIW